MVQNRLSRNVICENYKSIELILHTVHAVTIHKYYKVCTYTPIYANQLSVHAYVRSYHIAAFFCKVLLNAN